jgi:hypothetical protein
MANTKSRRTRTAAWRAATIAAIVATTIFAACGGGDDPDAVTEASPASAATATTAAAAPTAASATNALAPGRVTSEVFQPKLSLDLAGDNWEGEDNGGIFAVEHDVARGGETFCYIAIYRPFELRNPELFEEAIPLTDDIVGWIAAHPNVVVVEPVTDVVIGGLPARRVDITTDNEFPVFLFNDFATNTEDRIAFIEMAVEGRRLIIAAGGDNPFFWESTRECFEPVLASMQFE